MCGRPSSTIGFERRFNPVLALSRDDFLAYAATPPARPLNMTAIMATNQGTAELPWAQDVPDVDPPRVTVQQAKDLIAHGDPVILDVREPWEFDDGHLPGAVSVPQADLLSRIDELPRDRQLLVVCQSGARSRQAARFLSGQGFRAICDLIGGTTQWQESGELVEGVTRVAGRDVHGVFSR
jgi:rhodanese-related sulfurtransferase